ncbi:MAG: XdhC family protein, partial [Chloroflexota bacterium]
DVHQIINTYPQKALSTLHLDKSCAVVVLSHDPKLDDPALISALNTDVGYIGALGSRRTQQARNQRLQQQGYSDEDIKRIHGPIGLEIGATTPEEISIAIVAQIIQHQQQHTNRITRIQKPLCK